MKKESQVIFDRNVVEFVTVAAEFCKFLEQAETMKRDTFVDTSLKILPLLYLKAAMLPETEIIGDDAPESYVTEETDRKSTRLNSSHSGQSRMPSSA